MELGPAEDSGHSAAEQHGVEEDESADGGIRVFAKNHERDEPHSRSAQVELSRGVVCHRDADDAEQGIEGTHKGVVDIFGVLFSRLELEGAVVAGEDSGKTDEHLAQRGVDVEVVFMLDVVASELAKAARTNEVSGRPERNIWGWRSLLGLVPSDNIADANLPESSEEREGREDERGKDGLPLLEALGKGLLLAQWSAEGLEDQFMQSSIAYLLDKLLLVVRLARLGRRRHLRSSNRAPPEPVAEVSTRGDGGVVGSHGSELEGQRDHEALRRKLRMVEKRRPRLRGAVGENWKKGVGLLRPIAPWLSLKTGRAGDSKGASRPQPRSMGREEGKGSPSARRRFSGDGRRMMVGRRVGRRCDAGYKPLVGAGCSSAHQ